MTLETKSDQILQQASFQTHFKSKSLQHLKQPVLIRDQIQTTLKSKPNWGEKSKEFFFMIKKSRNDEIVKKPRLVSHLGM